MATEINYIADGGSASLVSAKGGTLMTFRRKGTNILFPQTKVGEKIRGGMHYCLPQFGPPKGILKEIGQHGWLRNELLEICSKSSKAMIFRGISKGRRGYPWMLEYLVNVSIDVEGILQVKLEVERPKDGIAGDAQINLAYHPYFRNLGMRAVKIGDREFDEFSEDANIVPLNGEKTLIIDEGARKVKMTLYGFGEESHVALWSDNKDYFCVEPMMTHMNDFDTPKGRYLKQGEKIVLSITIAVMT
ncbi:MAG: hypothetical protein V1841_01410 [Patescibacteria group bacterium]